MFLKNSLIGMSITNVIGSIYFQDNSDSQTEFENTDIIQYCFVFSDTSITISTNKDGESISITQDNFLENVDMQETGFIKVLDLTAYLKIKDYLELPLLNLKFIKNEQKIVGLLLIFSNETMISIINLGDDLYFFKGTPRHVCEDGYEIIE